MLELGVVSSGRLFGKRSDEKGYRSKLFSILNLVLERRGRRAGLMVEVVFKGHTLDSHLMTSVDLVLG